MDFLVILFMVAVIVIAIAQLPAAFSVVARIFGPGYRSKPVPPEITEWWRSQGARIEPASPEQRSLLGWPKDGLDVLGWLFIGPAIFVVVGTVVLYVLHVVRLVKL